MKILVPTLCGVATSLLAFLVLLLTLGEDHPSAVVPLSLLIGLFAALYAYFRMASEDKRKKRPVANLAAGEGTSPATPRTPPRDLKSEQKQGASQRPSPPSAAEKDEIAKQLKATVERISQNYQSFGKLRQDLVFENSLPLTEGQPTDLPEGRRLCESQPLSLQWHRWADGRFSFTLDGSLLPVAVYKRERVTISRTRETESLEGYCWRADVPSLEELLKDSLPEFQAESDGKTVARLFKDEVVHSTGLTTYLYLTLDKTKTSLEIQYYHDFDGE
jgi:hypothetical protein